nr:hypothetical protein [Tanacetum cinerariifolium]
MELKKILIEKMKGNKSIHRSNEQRNLYKALVEAYESDKIILDTYGDIITLKRRHDNDADKDEEPSAGPERGSKRRREGKEPESASALQEKATRSAGKSTQGVDTLTSELLAGPTYELMKGSWKSLTNVADYGHIKWIEDLVPRTMWIQEPIGYDKHALWGISHWRRKRQQFYDFAVNRESARDVYSKRRIIAVTELKIFEWHNYKHLDWITVRVEDLQLGVESYQKKLNLTKPDSYRSDLKRKEAYIANGTLIDVRTALDDRPKGIQMKYLSQSIWRKSDKDRAVTMIQAIDKRIKIRRIMRSLERFVGGRLYEGDFRMLQRTI